MRVSCYEKGRIEFNHDEAMYLNDVLNIIDTDTLNEVLSNRNYSQSQIKCYNDLLTDLQMCCMEIK